MSKKILIVEDYHALAAIQSQLAAMEGYDVRIARDGEEGLRLVEDYRPDLVILDLMLPGELGGEDVLRRMRAKGNETKVLIVSALVGTSPRAAFDEYSNVSTLAKPFKIRELSSQIGALLNDSAGTGAN